MLKVKTTTSPTLVAGAFTVTFGDLDKVNEAAVVFDGPNVADRVFEVVRTISGNVVTVTVQKMQVSATNTWGAALTADVASKTFTVVADGE